MKTTSLYKLGILLCLYFLVLDKFRLSLPKVQLVLANRKCKCKSNNPYAHRKDSVYLYILTTDYRRK